MDDHLSLPADGDVDALLDDWLATPPLAVDAALPPPVEEPAAPSRLSDAATLLEALAVDAAAAVVPLATDSAPRRMSARADRHVVFTSAGSAYAVLETSVTEAGRIPKITRVPRVPEWVRGVTSLRGEVLSVLDLRVFLGLEPTSLHTGRLLVVRLTPREDDELSLGLLVDSVDQIASVPRDDLRPPASPLEGALAPFVTGVARLGERLVAALDLDALLGSADIRQFDDRKPE
jgi:purine-binding chemotaxis protein CheW